ncbi:MAG: type IX secretion system membrane protein PorP/SprF [Bacteroidales bacterium]|nr:type IX secretion system membrane protein PorP/SprF [Bacteroidales bacterium]
MFERLVMLLFGLLFIFQTSFGQDPAFSQFYSNPIYLNPALVGTGDCSRLIFNYRNQWPSFSNNFITYSASADHYVKALSGGVGLIFTSDNAGGNVINTMRISGIYSYHLKIGQNSVLNAGFEGTYHQQKLNWEELIYQDMIDPVSGTVDPGSSGEIPLENNTIRVPDFAIGFVLGIKEKYYVGIAAHHLAQPKLNYYANSDENKLYRKYTLHAGARFNLSNNDYITESTKFYFSPNVLVQFQQNARQVNFGVYFERSPLVAGVWYRYDIDNGDGAIFLIGLTQKRFKLGYSYDLTLSKLQGATGGAHEVSLAILVNCDKKRNKPGAIKCPEF